MFFFEDLAYGNPLLRRGLWGEPTPSIHPSLAFLHSLVSLPRWCPREGSSGRAFGRCSLPRFLMSQLVRQSSFLLLGLPSETTEGATRRGGRLCHYSLALVSSQARRTFHRFPLRATLPRYLPGLRSLFAPSLPYVSADASVHSVPHYLWGRTLTVLLAGARLLVPRRTDHRFPPEAATHSAPLDSHLSQRKGDPSGRTLPRRLQPFTPPQRTTPVATSFLMSQLMRQSVPRSSSLPWTPI